ncbi:aspartate aminotransferase [Monoraphidium neglectum]|uniref:Aspartate aminotransferase n=1 Tax=Monoraphidium neglectum TaxID=145388 RepID=A0A0D2MQD6_9CHLO|nr:aspartate aminotransferase [Monoraphidium neglectum]KIZ04885.1 aspartate aminotransferase [Monoraphidium neglectum]|eukprot:XP_013903904.1 aspartate aminotransferase [Monoraphidium neglectum]
MSGREEALNGAAARLRTLSLQLAPSPCAAPAAAQSYFEGVQQAPPDSILGITEGFLADKSPNKLNLGVGAYRTEEGKPLVLSAVLKAQRIVVDDRSRNKARARDEYQPIGGNAQFCALSAALAYGPDFDGLRDGRVAVVQTLSGTGALAVGGAFLARHYAASKQVFVPNPTWGNHHGVFGSVGLTVKTYRYYHAATRALDYEGMLSDLRAAEPGAVVLLHACAHNPTGVDPTPDQWRGILAVVQERGLMPFFDSAYQGFASGDLDADAGALRMFASARRRDGSPQEMLLAQSFAKNMGLYGERVGALSVVTQSPEVRKRVDSQLKVAIRVMYSNPPIHGAAIAAMVMANPALSAEWQAELAGMAGRIKDMRRALVDALAAAGAPGNWDHITSQGAQAWLAA